MRDLQEGRRRCGVLMVLATELPDSMTSGYSVPWTRNGMPCMARACSAKQPMKAAPIALRFFSGSVMPFSDAKNRVLASMRTRGISKRRWNTDSTWSLPGPEQPGIHKHAREAIADGAVYQRCCDRAVDTTRESTERTFMTYSRTDILDGIVHETGHRPVA